MKVYMLGDMHFGDKELVATKRTQFADVDVHDNTIMKNILSTCSAKDTLYLLGDVVTHTSKLFLLKRLCEHIGNVYIVLGNHDCSRWPPQEGMVSVRELLACGVTEVYGMTSYKGMWLTHAPMHPEERHGRLNIHGHLHGKFTYDDDYLNVSCEALGFTPLDITSWMQVHPT